MSKEVQRTEGLSWTKKSEVKRFVPIRFVRKVDVFCGVRNVFLLEGQEDSLREWAWACRQLKKKSYPLSFEAHNLQSEIKEEQEKLTSTLNPKNPKNPKPRPAPSFKGKI